MVCVGVYSSAISGNHAQAPYPQSSSIESSSLRSLVPLCAELCNTSCLYQKLKIAMSVSLPSAARIWIKHCQTLGESRNNLDRIVAQASFYGCSTQRREKHSCLLLKPVTSMPLSRSSDRGSRRHPRYQKAQPFSDRRYLQRELTVYRISMGCLFVSQKFCAFLSLYAFTYHLHTERWCIPHQISTQLVASSYPCYNPSDILRRH